MLHLLLAAAVAAGGPLYDQKPTAGAISNGALVGGPSFTPPANLKFSTSGSANVSSPTLYWHANSTSAVFSGGVCGGGVTDEIFDIGLNTQSLDGASSRTWGLQWEFGYCDSASSTTVNEFILSNFNPTGSVGRRPFQFNVDWSTNAVTGIFDGDMKFNNSAGTHPQLEIKDDGTIDVLSNSGNTYLRSTANNTAWLYQRNAAGNADLEMLRLDTANRAYLVPTAGVDIAGPLVIGTTSATTNGLMLQTTTTPSTAAAGFFANPTINPSNNSNVYGAELAATGTTPSSVTTALASGVIVDVPTFNIGGGSTITQADTLHVSGAPSTGTNKYALYVDNGGGGGQSFVNGNLTVAAGGTTCYNGLGCESRPADGIVLLRDNATTSMGGIKLGGTTSSFPYLKRQSGEFGFRLADDSGYTNANGASFYANTAGGAGFIDQGGVLTAGTMTVTNDGRINCKQGHYSWTNAMVTALGAVTAGDITVATLPAKTVIHRVLVSVDTAAGTVTTLLGAVGTTAATYLDFVACAGAGCDLKAAANTIYGDAIAGTETGAALFDATNKWIASALPSFTATTAVKMHLVSTGGNLNTVTTSTGSVLIEYCLLQ